MDPMIEVLDTRLLRLIPDDAQIERIAGGFSFTEGPLWRGDHLLFSDIPNNRIVRWEEGPEGPSVRTFSDAERALERSDPGQAGIPDRLRASGASRIDNAGGRFGGTAGGILRRKKAQQS